MIEKDTKWVERMVFVIFTYLSPFSCDICVFCTVLLVRIMMNIRDQLAFFSMKLFRQPGYELSENGCHLYLGSVRGDGYCHLTYTNDVGTKTSISAHRAALMVNRNSKLPRVLQASHLCNEKRCINPQHLSLESNIINNQRKRCFSENRCTGHGGYPRCVNLGRPFLFKILISHRIK